MKLTSLLETEKTFHEWFDLVEKNGSLLRNTPDKFKTPRLCWAAVKNDGYAWLHLSVKMKRMRQFAQLAVQTVPVIMSQFPENMITQRLIEIAADAVTNDQNFIENNRDPSSGTYILRAAGEQFQTQEICNKIIPRYPAAFSYVSERFKTLEMCIEVVGKNGLNLNNVPDKWQKQVVDKFGWSTMTGEEIIKKIKYAMDRVDVSETSGGTIGELLSYDPEKLREVASLFARGHYEVAIEEIQSVHCDRDGGEYCDEGVFNSIVNELNRAFPQFYYEEYIQDNH